MPFRRGSGQDAYEAFGSRELKTLLEITDAVTGTLDVREVMQRVVRSVGVHVGADRCSILLVDEKSGRCFVLAANDNPEPGLIPVHLDKYPEIRRALETREPVIVQDVEHDPVVAPVRDVLERLGYRSLMVLPLVFGREVLGTMFLRANRKQGPFSPAEVRFCKVAAGSSANALKNALLYGDVAAEAERHRATSETLRAVLDGTPDLIVATDAAGAVTEFNRGAQALTGWSAEGARGRPLGEVMGDALDRAGLGLADLRDGVVERLGLVLRRGAVAEVELDLLVCPLEGPQGSAGRVWIGRDVTQLRRAERSLVHAERLVSLGEVVAGVAHELNNPLSAVLGYAQLLGQEHAGAPCARDLDRIVESARRCQRIVQNLLSFARRHPPERRVGDLNACVRKVLDLKGYHLRASRIEVVLELAETLPATTFDFHQIEQVVLNLLNNAEQALAAEGRTGRVVLRTRHDAERVYVEVEDDGPGVPETLRERIFEPFFTTKDAGTGTGLGLSVSSGLVREHGGEIALLPAAGGRWARFVIGLPRTRQPELERAAPTTAPVPHERVLTGRRVLVAEDEPAVLDLLSRFLREEGASVVGARDGQEAWERLAEAEFDLIVADLRMPRLDGRGLYERIARERPQLLRRLVFATGDVLRQETARFLDGIPNLILLKPLELGALRRALADVLGASGGLARGV